MIPFFKPTIGHEESEAVRKVMESGWLGKGPKVEEFENKIKEMTGTKYCICTNSCTSAIHLSTIALKTRDGVKSVISPSMTFISTILPAIKEKMSVNLWDVNVTSPSRLEQPILKYNNIQDNIMIQTSLYGNNRLRFNHGIEDGAHNFNHDFKLQTEMACFSFDVKKNITTGTGGAVVTNNKKLYELMRELSWYGIKKDTYRRRNQKKSWDYNIYNLGYKYEMNDIQASIGLEQMKKLKTMNKQRRQIKFEYDSILWESYIDDARNPLMMVYGFDKRDKFIKFMRGEGVDIGMHYKPIHDVMKKSKEIKYINKMDTLWQTDFMKNRIVTLPSYPELYDTPEFDKIRRALIKWKRKRYL